jgi:hypothetical protein
VGTPPDGDTFIGLSAKISAGSGNFNNPAVTDTGKIYVGIGSDVNKIITDYLASGLVDNGSIKANPLFSKGRDVVSLPSAGKTWHALSGNDTVTGTNGRDKIFGEAGNDKLQAGAACCFMTLTATRQAAWQRLNLPSCQTRLRSMVRTF